MVLSLVNILSQLLIRHTLLCRSKPCHQASLGSLCIFLDLSCVCLDLSISLFHGRSRSFVFSLNWKDISRASVAFVAFSLWFPALFHMWAVIVPSVFRNVLQFLSLQLAIRCAPRQLGVVARPSFLCTVRSSGESKHRRFRWCRWS